MIDPEIANQIKVRLMTLRKIRRNGSIPTLDFMKAEDTLRTELLSVGMDLIWINDVHGYGIVNNEQAEE